MSKDKKKIRADFRKNHQGRTRKGDLTRKFQREGLADDDEHASERLSGKGDLTRKRTIVGAQSAGEATYDVNLSVDKEACLRGRVLCVYGLTSEVLADDGKIYNCATRRLLKSLTTDQRHVVAAGDHVWFRPSGTNEGIIENVEPRTGTLSRGTRGKQHVIVTNVSQVLIVASAIEPTLKPNLIDRFLITAERIRVRPIICVNKVDLVDAADLQPLLGVYGRMGYASLLLSARTGQGVEPLRQLLRGRASVVAGQSGVGKSSLLNMIDPELNLRVREVSTENDKGKHTTTAARLIPLGMGGFVIDTPGIRQFQLWDVTPEEVSSYFRDLRPYLNLCRFPDCTHQHEAHCAVKDAVADGQLDVRRYESYCHIFAGDEA